MLIGITGTNGSGKGAVVEYLVSAKGYSRYSARTVILDELHSRHLVGDKSMRDVANALRKEHGAAYIVEQLYALAQNDANAVVESIRTIGEAEFLKGKGAHIIAVDGDRRKRYERVAGINPDLVELTFEEFCKIEDLEMSSSDPWDMNVFGVMQLADARIVNDGTLDELRAEVDAALATFT